jgi:hypothetical protein
MGQGYAIAALCQGGKRPRGQGLRRAAGRAAPMAAAGIAILTLYSREIAFYFIKDITLHSIE